jgi:acetate CoA/acetoacetate CoA-transferase beta subunit
MEPQIIIARRIARELAPGMLVRSRHRDSDAGRELFAAGINLFPVGEWRTGWHRRSSRRRHGASHADGRGRCPVTALPGASTFDSAMSFGLIRGGHLDLTVLGGLQVDQSGRLANWMIPKKMVPGMGGAMDLVCGAKRVIVAMQHTAKGRPKIVKQCSLPVTAVRPVDLVVTEMAVLAFSDGRAILRETGPGVSVAEIVAATEAELVVPNDVREMPH